MNMQDLPGVQHVAPECAVDHLPVIHMVESDDYRARLLIKSFNDSDEKGRRLMLQQAAAVAKLCAKDAA